MIKPRSLKSISIIKGASHYAVDIINVVVRGIFSDIPPTSFLKKGYDQGDERWMEMWGSDLNMRGEAGQHSTSTCSCHPAPVGQAGSAGGSFRRIRAYYSSLLQVYELFLEGLGCFITVGY